MSLLKLSLAFVSLVVLPALANAATLRVPEEHARIQSALDAAAPGDVVVVAAGVYRERIQLKPGVTLRSAGDQSPGKLGLKRAEATVLDGGGAASDMPGVTLAPGSVLDGFTVKGIGKFDQALWQKHFETRGEDLADEQGAAGTKDAVPAISVPCGDCRVVNNLVHDNGSVGIAIVGRATADAPPLVRANRCFRNLGGGIGAADQAVAQIVANTCHENLRAGIGCRGKASPLIVDNTCYGNVRAGIGCREGATPIIRKNRCYENRRAGIGIRMAGTAPIVEHNQCYENGMAGIGCRDQATPILRANQCRQNAMAGIGCDGSRPMILDNLCHENAMAGIGLKGQAVATITGNQCLENKLVAIGVTQGSQAHISKNHLVRSGGVPPLLAVKDGSRAMVEDNKIEGGGVAGLLIQGEVTAVGNRFLARNPKQGTAIWIWKDSRARVEENTVDGYRAGVVASEAQVAVIDNRIRGFSATAIAITKPTSAAHVFGNYGETEAAKAELVQVQPPQGVVAENQLVTPPQRSSK